MLGSSKGRNGARPVLYKHGLISNPGMHSAAEPEKSYGLYRNPEFRTVLWDRRMFAFDVSYITPALLESAGEIIARVDKLLADWQTTDEIHE